MLERASITIRGDTADISGVEQPTAKIHQITPSGQLVLKVPGHSYWSGRGEQSYAGAEFQVWQITRTAGSSGDSGYFLVRADHVVTISIRSNESSPDQVNKVLNRIAASS